MLDQRDLLVLAGGAAAAAQNYLAECLDLNLPREAGHVEATDEQLAAVMVATAFCVVLLRAGLMVNCRNPELRAQLTAITEGASGEIAKKFLDSQPPSANIVSS